MLDVLESLEATTLEAIGVRAADPLLVVGVFVIGSVIIARRSGGTGKDTQTGSQILSFAWVVLAVYWSIESLYWVGVVESPTQVRPWVGYPIVGIVVICLYLAVLSWRGNKYAHEVSFAFLVMGIVYIPFAFVPSLREFRIGITAEHTRWLVSAVGYSASVEGTTVIFHGEEGNSAIQILSTCTGISIMALFVGLFTFSSKGIKKRAVGAVGAVASLYAINLVKNAMLVVSTGTRFYDFVPELVEPYYQMELTGGYWLSFYVAEFVVAPVYVSIVLAVVYFGLVEAFPEIDRKVFRMNELIKDEASSLLR